MGLNTATVLNSSCIVHDATFWEEKEEKFSFSTYQPSYAIINAITQCSLILISNQRRNLKSKFETGLIDQPFWDTVDAWLTT